MSGKQLVAREAPHGRAEPPADAGVLKHGVTKSAHAAVWRGDGLPSARSRLQCGFSHALQRIDHGGGIDGVAHDGVSDLKRTCRRCRITQDDGHIMHELDTGRRGRHRRKQLKISKDALVARLAVDLAKRHRRLKRRSATRIGHRTVRAVCNRLIPASRRRFLERANPLIAARRLWRKGRFRHRLNYLSQGGRPRTAAKIG